MGNPLKGEVAFTTADGTSRKLSFSAEALFRLEEASGRRMNDLAAELRNPETFNLKTLRMMFWAGLLDSQPELQLGEVGPIFSKVAPMEAIELINLAFTGAFGTAPEDNAGPPGPGQQAAQAAAGTGSAS